MTDKEKDGIDIHLAYDPALETKLGALFGMSAADIVAAMSGISSDKPLDGPVNLQVRAANWYLNLYPSGQNLDILIGDKRYTIYAPTIEQEEAYQRLAQTNIPILEEVASFKGAASKKPFAVTSVPVEARLLSQLPLQDSAPTDSTDLGSLEILNEAGKLLANIKATTGKLPQLEGLSSFVFTPFKPTDFLQLKPPFSLDDGATIEEIGEKIKRDLEAQNPTQESLEQLKAFFSGFNNYKKKQ